MPQVCGHIKLRQQPADEHKNRSIEGKQDTEPASFSAASVMMNIGRDGHYFHLLIESQISATRRIQKVRCALNCAASALCRSR